jgi:hypothetical protein
MRNKKHHLVKLHLKVIKHKLINIFRKKMNPNQKVELFYTDRDIYSSPVSKQV